MFDIFDSTNEDNTCFNDDYACSLFSIIQVHVYQPIQCILINFAFFHSDVFIHIMLLNYDHKKGNRFQDVD